MTEKVQFYAIVGRGRSADNPSGLVRRRTGHGEPIDESLRRDLSWGTTIAIEEWTRGEELTRDLVEISEADANALVERFREKWGREE